MIQVQGKDLQMAAAKAVEKARVAGFQQEQLQVLAGVCDLIDHALVNLSESAKISESRNGVDIIGPANQLLNALSNLRSVLDDPSKVTAALQPVARAQNNLLGALKALANAEMQNAPPELIQVNIYFLLIFLALF